MLMLTGSVEKGKKIMTPAESDTSVATWAHCPITTPAAQLRLLVTAS